MSAFPHLIKIPFGLLSNILTQMDQKEFQQAFAVAPAFKRLFERVLKSKKLKLTPIYHLDLNCQEILIEKFLVLKEEYLNRILKNIQNHDFTLCQMFLEFEVNRRINVEEVLSDLDAQLYWREGSTTFSDVPTEQIDSSVKAVFGIRNQKSQIFLVRLTETSLGVTPIEGGDLLAKMREAVAQPVERRSRSF